MAMIAAALHHLFVVLLLLLLLPAGRLCRFSSTIHSYEPAANGTDDDACDGRRIYIRALPALFNSELLTTCSAFSISDTGDFCAYLPNHALGPRTHPRTFSWHRTDPRLLEPLFHHRLLLDYPCLTDSPLLANAVFVPYYAAIDSLPYLLSASLFNSSFLHGVHLSHYLHRHEPEILARRHGHDHFLVLAGPAWDFSQDIISDPEKISWGTSFLKLPHFQNFTVLTLESRGWPWQERAVPPPTSFHPSTLSRLQAWLARAARSPRTALMLFAGGGATPAARPNIRSAIHSECTNRTDRCVIVDCSAGSCSHDPIKYMKPMLRAKFCLQPPGDTPTRRSTFDSIIAGCVPVFFEDLSAKTQFRWHLPVNEMEEWSVFIPKEDVVFGGVRIGDVLAAIPSERARRMRQRLLEIAPTVMYRRHQSEPELSKVKDAFDVAIDGVLRRIRKRIQALQDPDPERIYLESDDD